MAKLICARISHVHCKFARSIHINRMICDENIRMGQQFYSDTQPLKREQSEPIITSRDLKFMTPGMEPKKAWVESLLTVEQNKIGMVDLHPDIFGVVPRLDILWWNIFWQQKYRLVDYRFVPNRSELPDANRKPWPQKGLGRARQGSIRAGHFQTGGKTFGPRGPKSYFFMLALSTRVLGLCTALTTKFAQDNLKIVDNLELPTDSPEHLKQIVESRGWGLSVLFINENDMLPEYTALAFDAIQEYNVMPLYGLNVYSMLKHETVVLTLGALEKLEERLLHHMHKQDFKDRAFNRMQTYT